MTFDQREIEWTDYWPKNARVPRLDPNEVAAPPPMTRGFDQIRSSRST